MHVKVSRTLHAHEICEMWHTWLCDLVITCIVNFGECCDYVELWISIRCLLMLVYLRDDVDVKIYCWMTWLRVYLLDFENEYAWYAMFRIWWYSHDVNILGWWVDVCICDKWNPWMLFI
jgi:hypothetical protein